MARRRLTLKRIDPWSVLKFGFVANLALLAIGLLGAGIIWFFVRQLELIEKVCEIAGDVGFVECGVNGGNLFRALLLLGLLGTVIQTGLMVFLAFLHNLIADLVGGISFTYTEEGGTGSLTSSSGAVTASRSVTQRAAKPPAAAGGRPASSSPSSPPVPAPAPSGSGAGSSSGRPSGGWSSDVSTSGQGSSGASPASPPSSPPSQPASPATGGSGPGSGQQGSSPGPSPGSAGQQGSSQGSGPPDSERTSSSAGGDWDLFGPRGSGGSGG